MPIRLNIYKQWVYAAIVLLVCTIIILYYTIYRKNNISLGIIAQFKNEAMGIREWVEHYIWQGADYILLMNNESTDNWREKIQDLLSDKIVAIDTPGTHIQAALIKDKAIPWAIEKNIDVVAILDLDEFMFLKDGTKLKEAVQKIFGKKDRPSQFRCKWTIFGSSGLEKQPESIRKSFTWGSTELSTNIKSVTWVKDIDFDKDSGWPVFHALGVKGEYIDCPSEVQINHYIIQSKEFFEKVKMKRGDSGGAQLDTMRTWDYFNDYDHEDIEHMDLKDQVEEYEFW